MAIRMQNDSIIEKKKEKLENVLLLFVVYNSQELSVYSIAVAIIKFHLHFATEWIKLEILHF